MENELMYGIDVFRKMEGSLDIIGMSPCNDSHLFLEMDWSNLHNINYYYKTDADRNTLRGMLKKPVTFVSVDKLWKKI